MTDNSGALSIDFIVGFTVFLIAFIWVLSMIPGLLIGLQAFTIDYDAVSYRTGVMLVEDPGEPASPPWESQQNFSVVRLGLAVSRDTPNILSQGKVDRFFANTSEYGAFAYPEDYRQRIIFGDYPYRFNISIFDVEKNQTLFLSESPPLPDGYGYIRRLVKIKGLSNATINESYIVSHQFINPDNNVTSHEFSILVNNSRLKEQKNPAYEIDPARESILVNITDIRKTLSNQTEAGLVNITLTKINVYKVDAGVMSLVRTFNTPYIDQNSSTTQPPVEVNNGISLKFTPAFFDILNAGSSPVYINLSFNLTQDIAGVKSPYSSHFLNNTWSSPFEYDYDPSHVKQPQLRDAMVEVAIW
jgi:hypothetical protein